MHLAVEKDMILHFNKLEHPLSNDDLCQMLWTLALWFRRANALVVLEKKVFEKTLINVFSFTGYCLPLEMVLSFILTNLNPLLQGMLCDKFDTIEIGPWVLEKKIKL